MDQNKPQQLSFSNRASLVPANDMTSTGEKVMSVNLHVDNQEQFCPMQPAIFVPPAIQGAQFQILRPACNSRCPLFKVKSMDKIVDEKKESVATVQLLCGSGTIYELEKTHAGPQANLSPLTRV